MSAVYHSERVFYHQFVRPQGFPACHLPLQQRPQRGLDSLLQARPDGEIRQRVARGLTRLSGRISQGQQRGHDFRLPAGPPPPASAPADDPAAATFSLSSRTTRAASFLPTPGTAVSSARSSERIASWRSPIGREPTIPRATFGPTPVTVRRSPKKPNSSGLRKPYNAWRSSRITWWVKSLSRPPTGVGKHRRRREDAIAHASHFEDERVRKDCADGAVE